MNITIAHSPDADDFYLFWAIAQGRIPCGAYSFSFEQHDTARLNELARDGDRDVVAVSVANLANIADRYLVLPHGASIGRNYGPVVVASRPISTAELGRMRIGIPGRSTTAALVLRTLAPAAATVEYPIVPFNTGFAALEQNEIDALLLIHEGQISYRARGLHKIVDVGEWWNAQSGLPLPLGVNVIRADLGTKRLTEISAILRESILYAQAHREEVLGALVALNTERSADVHTRDQIAQYLDMYANADTAELKPDCREAIERLLPGISLTYAP